MEEKLHIGISVKDFKAIVIHADTLGASVIALYSSSSQPLQLRYSDQGMVCEFTLMTTGEHRGTSITPAPKGVNRFDQNSLHTRENGLYASTGKPRSKALASMPPPPYSTSRTLGQYTSRDKPTRPSPPVPRASIDEQSLFVGEEEEEEKTWGEKNYDEDEGHLRWVGFYMYL